MMLAMFQSSLVVMPVERCEAFHLHLLWHTCLSDCDPAHTTTTSLILNLMLGPLFRQLQDHNQHSSAQQMPGQNFLPRPIAHKLCAFISIMHSQIPRVKSLFTLVPMHVCCSRLETMQMCKPVTMTSMTWGGSTRSRPPALFLSADPDPLEGDPSLCES